MEKTFKYYQIAASEYSYRVRIYYCKVAATKLWP